MIYLDHNATTPLDERVLTEMLPFMRQHYGNPSAVHQLGRFARDAVEQARQQVADLTGAHPSQVIFTSGGTEANNLAIKGLASTLAVGGMACSAVEHPSVSDVMKFLATQSSVSWSRLPVTTSGTIDLNYIRKSVETDSVGLLSVMLANNETGVVNDVAALRALFPGTVIHTDAVQAAGKIPVDFSGLDVDMMSLSAHKLYGPKGAGALVVNKALPLQAQLHGGGQEKGRRSGTENVAAIVGFGAAAALANSELSARQQKLEALRARLLSQLRQISGVQVFGDEAPARLPNTVFFTQHRMEGETLLMALDGQGIAVGSGSACSSKTRRASPVLLAMQVDEMLAANAIRVSLGAGNTEQDIDTFCLALAACLNMMNSSVLNPA